MLSRASATVQVSHFNFRAGFYNKQHGGAFSDYNVMSLPFAFMTTSKVKLSVKLGMMLPALRLVLNLKVMSCRQGCCLETTLAGNGTHFP